MTTLHRALCAALLLAGTAGAQSLALWYRQPAEDWQSQALPIGNGRLGAMIFGDARREHLQLNEISLWTGDEKDTGRYQNLADLFFDLSHGAPQAYRRSLDIDSAIHSIQYSADGTTWQREYFASAPQQTIVLRFTATKRGAYSGTLKLTDAHRARTTASGNQLTAGGKLENGLEYETEIRGGNTGGKITDLDGALRIENADTLTIFVAAGTNYLPNRARAWRGESPHARIESQLFTRCCRQTVR